MNTKHKRRKSKPSPLRQMEYKKAMEEIIPVLVEKGFLAVARVERVIHLQSSILGTKR